MKQSRKRLEKRSFVNVFDIPCNEAWLEDEARGGLRAVRITRGGQVKFEYTEPFTCRYRLQPTKGREGRPDEEEIELYASMGWDYVGTMKGYVHVWRCEDADAPELDTDPVAQAEGYRRLVKKSIWNHAVLLTANLGILAFLLYRLLSRGPYYFVWYTVPGCLIAVVLCLVVGGLLSVFETEGLIRMVRRLRDGIPLERSENCWEKRTLMQMSGAVLTVLVLWNTGLGGLVSPKPNVAYAETGGVPAAGAVYPNLGQLEGRPEANVDFFLPKVKHHELAPTMWFITQYADHEDQPSSQLVTDYYHMLGAFLVPQMEEKLLENYCDLEYVKELTPVNPGKLERFWWTDCIHHDRREQYAVAVLGRNIMAISYQGPADLREHTELFAEALAAQ